MNEVIAFWVYCRALVSSRVNDDRGASLVEYTLLVGLIALVCIGAITVIGDTTDSSLRNTGSSLLLQ